MSSDVGHHTTPHKSPVAGERAEAATSARSNGSMLDALDLPPELHAIQSAYWEARREWNAREAAYLLVVRDVLAYQEVREVPPEDEEIPA